MTLMRLLSLSLTFLLLLCSGIPAKAADAPAIAFAARVVGDESRVRLIMDFDRKIKHDVYLLDQPKRMIIDLPQTLFSLDDETKSLPKSLVSGIRYGAVAPGQSRLILELSGPVSIAGNQLKAVESGARHRIIVDLVASSNEAFVKSARKAKQPKVAAPSKKSDKHFRILLDPGHGGIDGGATGAGGTVEKHVTLGFALQLREQLEKNPAFNVLMTRDGDEFVGLEDRLSIARRNKVDLFVSIHADSLNQRAIRGATIYTLSREGSDEISRILARKQNRADLIAGLSLPKIEENAEDILIDLTRRETAVFSTRFARLMVNEMKDDIKLIRNPHRSADFFVLKAPEIPSVLLELGYLSNPDDEKLMQSKKWQELAASKAARAVEAFFKSRLE